MVALFWSKYCVMDSLLLSKSITQYMQTSIYFMLAWTLKSASANSFLQEKVSFSSLQVLSEAAAVWDDLIERTLNEKKETGTYRQVSAGQ